MNKRIQDKQVTQNIDVTITKADKFDTKKQQYSNIHSNMHINKSSTLLWLNNRIQEPTNLRQASDSQNIDATKAKANSMNTKYNSAQLTVLYTRYLTW